MSGEITPAYSLLAVDDIKRIRCLFPEVKILMTLRNPIDRAWSHIRFDAKIGLFKHLGDLEKMRGFVDSRRQVMRGDYLRTLDNWSKVFPDQNFFLGFYDEILEQPEEFMRKVCDFLGLDCIIPHEKLDTKVNSSPKLAMPRKLETYIAEKYYDDILELTRRFGGYTLRWLHDAEAALRHRRITLKK
jgi:hypothetical protein